MARAAFNGIEIEYETFDEPQRSAVILISGLGVSMTRWPVGFCQLLVDRGYFVVRFDNRDVGLSTSFVHEGAPALEALAGALARGERPRVPYTLWDMVDDVAALMDALAVGVAHVVGRSLGGMIAQLFASRYARRTLSLTSIMSGTGNPALPPPRPEAMAAMMSRGPDPTDDLEGYLDHAARFSLMLASPGFPTPEAVTREALRAELKRSYTPTSVLRQIAALAVVGDVREYLRTIQAPTLIIHGKDDPLIPVESGVDSARNIPGADLWIIDGMGHDFPEQLHGEFARRIDENARRGASALRGGQV